MEEKREVAICAEHVRKHYRLGVLGTTTLKRDLQTKWALFRGKEDPNAKIGHQRVEGDTLHALDDVSFKIYKGERIGIIGQNGAGKSTLLKLICRITAPSDGYIGYNGKVTSMLEVGTGFHPELTGRENIYMNGAILGMSRKEVSEVFDEIVEFSEVGDFIDTPVKRYSSGMYVRLAFSVAAHLRSDIVIMDEVLAVGDLGFQEKCIQRMREIAEGENRTILYVSHNMETVLALCDRCLVMRDGKIVFDGDAEEAEQFYRRSITNSTKNYAKKNKGIKRDTTGQIRVLDAGYMPGTDFDKDDVLRIRIRWKYREDVEDMNLRIQLHYSERPIASKLFLNLGSGKKGQEREEVFEFPINQVQNGSYSTHYTFYQTVNKNKEIHLDRVIGLPFTINDKEKDNEDLWLSKWWGPLRLK